jgi:hypothetical protein
MFQSLRIAYYAVCAAGLGVLASQAPAGDDKGFVDLFNGKDLTGWKTILSSGKADEGKVFTVNDGVVVVSGNPNGYFYTEKSYKNYVLRFDWKFIKDGNSGLLVHITGKHIFAINGATGSFKKDAAAQKKAIKIGEWNTTEVTVKDGEITSKINGIQIATGKCDLMEGPFGFQSEGTELHFKNIKIKTLD